MVDIDFSQIDTFLAEVEREQLAFNNQISLRFREWVRAIFYDIVELTPQWSGNLAANWNISTSSLGNPEETIPAKAYMWPLPLYVEPHKRGDPEAVGISKARFDDAEFGYSNQVYIYNPVEIAPAVEAQSIHIRGVNLVDGRVAMIAHAYAVHSNFSSPL